MRVRPGSCESETSARELSMVARWLRRSVYKDMHMIVRPRRCSVASSSCDDHMQRCPSILHMAPRWQLARVTHTKPSVQGRGLHYEYENRTRMNAGGGSAGSSQCPSAADPLRSPPGKSGPRTPAAGESPAGHLRQNPHAPPLGGGPCSSQARPATL